MSLSAVCPGVTQCVDRRPAVRLSRGLLIAGLLLAAGLAQAAQGEPPAPDPVFGSIEQAQAAADAAKADSDRIKRQYDVEAAACMHKFFANRCAEKARLERNAGVTRADGTRRQAELYIRREESRERHARRDRDNAERDAKAADRAARKAEETAGRPPAESGATAGPAPANPPRGAGEVRPRPSRAVDDPEVRARNRAKFERKQEEAREYAEKHARDRQESEAKRARRRAEREEEAVRLGAPPQEEGAPAPAGKP